MCFHSFWSDTRQNYLQKMTSQRLQRKEHCTAFLKHILCSTILAWMVALETNTAQLGIKLRFEGTGVEEKGIVVSVTGHDAPGVKPGDVIIAVDPRYFRPAEVETLLGDPTKAHEKLGWKPEITLREMVSEMVANDLEAAKKHSLLKSHGYDVAIALES